MFGKYLLYPLFLILSVGVGCAIGFQHFLPVGGVYGGALLGFLIGLLFVGMGIFLEKFGTKRLLWGVLGFFIGAIVSGLMNILVEPLLAFLPLSSPPFSLVGPMASAPAILPAVAFAWKAISFLFFSFLGVTLALKVEREPYLMMLRTSPISNSKILDTSVIIDGRIADLCETGFLEGTFLMPQFVLQELQYVADSADSTRRVRGRRGLDILHRLQKMANFDLRIIDDDFPAIREVDAKIVALARQLSAKVVTNDLNLNKVAGLQGVTVLNINQLSNALKQVVLPGEMMRVFVLKEGKETGQGVAYLDDGTMIVIDDAKKWIGRKVDVVVTSVLQTAAGRMIFSKLREDQERERETFVAAKTG